MSNAINQNILLRLDRDNIDTYIAATTPMQINTKNLYSPDLPVDGIQFVGDMDTDTLEAFKVYMDFVSYQYEATFPIVKVAFDAGTKTFDLSGSYLRDKVETQAVTALTDNMPITVRFEFPGFESNKVVEITYPYNGEISVADKDLLAESGVVVTMDGVGFNVTNSIDCKVYFAKPESEAGTYVIDYPAVNTILPADA